MTIKMLLMLAMIRLLTGIINRKNNGQLRLHECEFGPACPPSQLPMQAAESRHDCISLASCNRYATWGGSQGEVAWRAPFRPRYT